MSETNGQGRSHGSARAGRSGCVAGDGMLSVSLAMKRTGTRGTARGESIGALHGPDGRGVAADWRFSRGRQALRLTVGEQVGQQDVRGRGSHGAAAVEERGFFSGRAL